ncbi:uncharacterized protein LOC116114489 [Pistacia vera]|uniref:uncharacterized protein LOC116114489 n=1 Tax=Pistacia vera TaxID=55513 RepID=UPI001263321A|nr:uncharacterized protein LOC116114489 [Pistacia vera]
MLRIICRTALSKSQNYAVLTSSVNPHHHNNFTSKSNNSTNKKKQPEDNKKSKSKPSDASTAVQSESATSVEEMELARARARRLAEDDRDTFLDVGPNNRPLFTKTPSLSLLTRKDACTYFKFSEEELNEVLPEGLPTGMLEEFKESMRHALLVRQSFLDLRDNFRRIVDPPMLSSNGPKVRKQVVLDGPRSCGKSIMFAMLVHWARDEGWLVFYVPRGREWTHGGYFYKNPQTGLWDTPLQVEHVLKARILSYMV